MNLNAVITGDLVKSSKIIDVDIAPVINSLKHTFNEINKLLLNGEGVFEIYRGDSFQGLIPKPEMALLASLIIRAHLRSYKQSSKETGKKSSKPILRAHSDARIGIGIGGIIYNAERVTESQGEAFEKSGHAFDDLKQDNERLKIGTPWADLNEELAVECKLVDALISGWSTTTAEAMYHYLLYDRNQKELATQLKITQPGVHKRLVLYGNAPGIQAFLERYQHLISKAR